MQFEMGNIICFVLIGFFRWILGVFGYLVLMLDIPMGGCSLLSPSFRDAAKSRAIDSGPEETGGCAQRFLVAHQFKDMLLSHWRGS